MSRANKFIIRLKGYNRILTKQQIKTLKGQAIKGEVEATEKGLEKILNRLDKSIVKRDSCT